MRFAEHCAKAIGVLGHEDEMNVVVHQAPGEAARALRCRGLGEKLEVGTAIIVGEENGQPPVTALGDVMRNTGKNDACKTGHTAAMSTHGPDFN